jgi:hypothetical protein
MNLSLANFICDVLLHVGFVCLWVMSWVSLYWWFNPAARRSDFEEFLKELERRNLP